MGLAMNSTSTPPPAAPRRGSAFASLADLSIRRPVFAWMLMAALIIFGAIGLSRLGVSEQPDVDFPVLTINATWSGSAPEIMETEIVGQDRGAGDLHAGRAQRHLADPAGPGLDHARIRDRPQHRRGADRSAVEAERRAATHRCRRADHRQEQPGGPADHPAQRVVDLARSPRADRIPRAQRRRPAQDSARRRRSHAGRLPAAQPARLGRQQQAKAAAADHPRRQDRTRDRAGRGGRRLPRKFGNRIQCSHYGAKASRPRRSATSRSRSGAARRSTIPTSASTTWRAWRTASTTSATWPSSTARRASASASRNNTARIRSPSRRR